MQNKVHIFLKTLGARWRLGVVALLAVLAVGVIVPGTAAAATGSLYAQHLTLPGGGLWLPGPGGGHLWVADHLQGLCRIDAGALNAATCTSGPVKVGQPAFDPARNLVYVPDPSSKSLGIWRFHFTPSTQTLSGGTVIASSAVLGLFRPTALALNATGSFLFMGFLRTGSITRINGPAVGTTQGIHTIGHSADGGAVSSLALLGASQTLHLAEASGVSVLPSTCVSGCVAQPHPNATLRAAVPAPLSLVAAAATGSLFVGDATGVVRFTARSGAVERYATASSTGTAFSNVSGLVFRAATSTVPALLHVLDDPTAGATPGTGRAWRVALNQPALGPASAPPASPSAGAALTTSTAFAQPVTFPAGGLWLGTHLWVADHLQGLCRLDAGALNAATCTSGPVKVGQPAFDAATNQVYVPDPSSKSLGVWRFAFSPATQTLSAGVVLATGAGLGLNRPAAVALEAASGELLVSFLRSGSIVRLSGPASGTSQSAAVVGVSSDGGGVASLAPLGSDLYLAEAAAVTKLGNVAACAGGCQASAVAALAGITAPLALGADPAAGRLYVGDATGIMRLSVGTGALAVYANTSTTGLKLSNVTGLVLRPATLSTPAALFALDDVTAGETPFTGRVWQLPVLV